MINQVGTSNTFGTLKMTWVKYLKDTVFDPNDNVPIGTIELMLVRVNQKGVVPSYQHFTFDILSSLSSMRHKSYFIHDE